jgi:integrase
MSRPRGIPSYRRHKSSGQAIVTLTDPSGTRRDVLLGKYGTAASRHEYARVLAEWEAAGQRMPPPGAANAARSDLTITELIAAYWRFAKEYYGFTTERGDAACLKSALAVVRSLYGDARAIDFGPLALKACRQKMVEKGWSRGYVNAQIDRLRRMFRWAGAEELLPVTVYQNLQAVPGLRRGKSEARETARVKPADPEHVKAALHHMPRPVQGMVRFQMLTGCRPTEACLLRAMDLDMSNPSCWIYRPGSDQGAHGEHKTAHHGHDRLILIGPRAQEIIRPFLTTNLSAYLFCPQEATRERNEKRRASRQTPLYPSHVRLQVQKRKQRPRRAPGQHYTARTYARAIARACRKAGVPEWGPNRLRHSRATELRSHGLDMVKTILGHSKVETSQVYAEKDIQAAMELVSRIG